MNINGKNGLACLTNMRTLKDPIVLKPLPGLPVIRDLIVDMTQFFKQYHSIKPYLINDDAAAREGAPAVARGARRAERPVRVHPVRVLLDRVPELLVEPRQVRRPGRAAAGLPLHRRQPRRGDQRAARQPRGPVPPVPLPHDHELRRRLPEGAQPDARHRQDQGADGEARRLMDADACERRDRLRSTRALSKLRWRCRRGLLENDLLIERFFARCGRVERGRRARPELLMELPDNELLDLLLGRKEPTGDLDRPEVRQVIEAVGDALSARQRPEIAVASISRTPP